MFSKSGGPHGLDATLVEAWEERETKKKMRTPINKTEGLGWHRMEQIPGGIHVSGEDLHF
jgi:hypothetical protein